MTTRKIDILLSEYGESHKNATNKLIHWICVPAIMFSIMGLFYTIPFSFITERTIFANCASVIVLLTLVYYATLSLPIFIGFILVGGAMVAGNHYLFEWVNSYNINYVLVSIGIFAIAWIGQFIGHGIEGKKPSFLKDLQFLLVGPAWLLHFIFKSVGIRY
jgi:uncharacterized membrane protein YGL010W